MNGQEKIIIGISIGDVNGIGGEIILKTFEDSRMLDFCTPVIFGSVRLISFYKKQFKSALNFHGIDTIDDVIVIKINVLNVWKELVEIKFGEENSTDGN